MGWIRMVTVHAAQRQVLSMGYRHVTPRGWCGEPITQV
jgi:hypothetical protein